VSAERHSGQASLVGSLTAATISRRLAMAQLSEAGSRAGSLSAVVAATTVAND
jgi:hypothetical protein